MDQFKCADLANATRKTPVVSVNYTVAVIDTEYAMISR